MRKLFLRVRAGRSDLSSSLFRFREFRILCGQRKYPPPPPKKKKKQKKTAQLRRLLSGLRCSLFEYGGYLHDKDFFLAVKKNIYSFIPLRASRVSCNSNLVSYILFSGSLGECIHVQTRQLSEMCHPFEKGSSLTAKCNV